MIDRDGDRAAAVAGEIGARSAVADVADGPAMEAAIAEAEAAHGPVRIAVACAGIAPGARIVGRDGPHDLDQFRRTVEVNLVGTFNLLRLAAARMAAADPLPGEDGERGLVVMTASIAAFEGRSARPRIRPPRAGVAGLTLPAARELARHGVRVVTVAPGLIGTPMVLSMPDAVRESLEASTVYPPRLGRRRSSPTWYSTCRQPAAQRRGDPPRRRGPAGAAVTGRRWGPGRIRLPHGRPGGRSRTAARPTARAPPGREEPPMTSDRCGRPAMRASPPPR